jgi:hypothetical protein
MPPAYAAPPAKKKSKVWLFVLIGLLVVALGVGGFFVITNLFGKGWSGGTTSSDLPAGYTAIVSNENIVIGIGEVTPYEENDGTVTLKVELYVINKSGYAVYAMFDECAFDGRQVSSDSVYSTIWRTEPRGRDEGFVRIQCLYHINDLNRWTGTIVVFDDDTWDITFDVLGTYTFDLTYRK